MAPETAWYEEDVVLPALMRAARRTYGSAMRAAIVAAGCDDMPRNGAFVVGSIARNGSPLREIEITRALGISRDRAAKLFAALVERGYLDRTPDPADPEGATVALTERGTRAAAAGRSAVEQVDADLVARVGSEAVSHTRRTLGALIQAGYDADGDHDD